MCNEREQLKIDLMRIKENKYNLNEDEKTSDYLDLMFKYIGDTDEELRDKLICRTFINWIEIKQYFNHDELLGILNKVLSEDFAFYKMGNENDDSVLKRSFSILLVDPILCVHQETDFTLNLDTIIKIKNSLIRYFNEEKDLRGYDLEKGWIHSLAHAADGINQLLNCEGITKEICIEIMQSIENRVCEGKNFFTAEEDERIVTLIYYDIMLDKLLSDDYICNWLKGLAKVLEIEDSVTRFKARTNVKNLIRSLYFRMIHYKNNEQVANTIVELERQLNLFTVD